MTGIMVNPGTSATLAQSLQRESSMLNVVPQDTSVLTAHVGVDWQQWSKVSTSMLDTALMSRELGLGQQLDTYL